MSEVSLSLKERFRLSRFVRGENPVDHPLTLTHRRIFILPSQRGLGFMLLVLLLLLIAFVYNNNLTYLLAFLLASVFVVTILHTFKTLAGLIVTPAHSQSAFVGEAVCFTFYIDNPVRQPRVHFRVSSRSEQFISLAGLEQKAVVLYADTHKRGLLTCPTLTLSSTYPLGLFRAWSPLRFNLTALVYPKPADIEMPFPQTDADSGEQGQGRKGRDDFYGIKNYERGDPIRQIHWKAFAKGQGLYSKEYAGAISRELWLDYEATPGHDIEERLSRLCRWIIDAEQADLSYGLILPTIKLDPDHGRVHYEKCLKALALL